MLLKNKKWNKQEEKERKINKFQSEFCTDKMTFEDCEIAILRHAVDESENIKKKDLVNNSDISKIIEIVETFLKNKKLVCYGGTAINNILPKDAQFYNYDLEIPDYDFFSPNALYDAKELADIYFNNGYTDVEAKAGVHMGTFKVFVNFIPIADITFMNQEIYNNIFEESIEISGIHYAPPNYLRMAVYLELSRPLGDVSRWEKVMKRLNLLNHYYPLAVKNCDSIDFQRKLDKNDTDSERMYLIVRDSLIDQGIVFFGGYAISLYAQYMPKEQQYLLKKIPDFDVLSEDYEKTAIIIKEILSSNGFKNIEIIKHEAIGEIIPENIQILVDDDTIAFIYKPIACHSYNIIHIHGKDIKIASIDTILTFYLSFTYANFYNFYKDRLLCMAKFLFDVELKNRLEQRGLLKRFSVNCYGKQDSIENIRGTKAQKYKELADKKNTEEYEMWFLKYTPSNNKLNKNKKQNKKMKKEIKNQENKKEIKNQENKKEIKNQKTMKNRIIERKTRKNINKLVKKKSDYLF
jgi:hypothetical protein